MRVPGIALLLFGALAAGACGAPGGSGRATASPPGLTVAAASSVQPAFEELAAAYRRATGTEVILVFGASGTLAQQVLAGAPYDVFASADGVQVDRLAERGAVARDARAVYALGRLALVARSADPFRPRRLEDLLRPEVRRIAVANPEHAPYGLAARQTLERAGLWDALAARIVIAENVRQALEFVRTGNAEAGIVALSLARDEALSVTPLAGALHDPLVHELAAVAGRPREAEARRFAAFVTGAEGRRILATHGFDLPGGAGAGAGGP